VPHVIIEYSQDVLPESQINYLIEEVFQAIVSTNVFEPENIKIRAVPYTYYKVGSGDKSFTHVQLRIHPGRNAEKKRKLTTAVVAAVRGVGLKIDVITAEVIEMDKSTYAKDTI